MTDIERMKKKIHHDDPEVRWIAILELEEMKDEPSLHLIMEALGDRDYESIRWRAAVALAVRRDPIAVPALIEALRDPNYHVREEATTALGLIRDSRAIEAIIPLLSDPARSVRLRAMRALEQFGEQAVEHLDELLRGEGTTIQGMVLEILRDIKMAKYRKER